MDAHGIAGGGEAGTFKDGVRHGVGRAAGRRNTLPGSWMFENDTFVGRWGLDKKLQGVYQWLTPPKR